MVRPKVTKITVEVEGKEDIIIDTTTVLPEAIFFGDKGVYQILAPFYVGKDIKMEKDEVKTNWGENIADKIFGPAAPGTTLKKIDDTFINDAWTTADDNGDLLVMLIKMPDCPLR